MKKIGYLVGILGFFLSACATPANGHYVQLQGPHGTLKVQIEIAATEPMREKGLMNRTSLAANTGMLFVMDDERLQTFWMKNTLIPLDILFFDAHGKLVSSASMVPCKADPCALYPSAAPARYALEVPSGFIAEHDINADWSLHNLGVPGL